MTSEQYAIAKMRIAEYDAASLNYRTLNKTNGIPEAVWKTFPHADIVDNALKGLVEVYEFLHDKPERYFLYITTTPVMTFATTWVGDKLGTVVLGREWRSNFGDKRQAVTVKGINGVTYVGTYYKGAGQYARIRAKKTQKGTK